MKKMILLFAIVCVGALNGGQGKEESILNDWILIEKKSRNEAPGQMLKRLQSEYANTQYGPMDEAGENLFNSMQGYYDATVSSSILKLDESYADLQNFIRKDLLKYIEKNSSVFGIQKDMLMDAFTQLSDNSRKLTILILGVKASILQRGEEQVHKLILEKYIDQLNLLQKSISAIRVQLASIKYNLAKKISAQALLLGALDMVRLITVKLLVLLTDKLKERYEGSESEGGSMYYTPESSEEEI
jgi:hypothetical protein